MTPLHFAALFRGIDYASSLIAGGADVNAKASPTSSGSNWYPSSGLTPLICALIVKHEHMIRLSVSKGASLALATTNEGFAHVLLSTAPYELGDPSTTGSIFKCMRHLVWNIDSFLGETGQSVLHGVAGTFDAKFTEALMSLGLDPTLKDEYGHVPVQVAIHHMWEHPGERKATMDTLLQRDSYAQLNSQDKDGRAALHTALCGPNEQLKQDKDKRAALRSTLCKRGNPNDQLNIQSKCSQRDSLGHYFIRAALVDYLIACGSNVLLKDKRGDLPLNCVVLASENGVIRMLLKFHTKEQLISRNFARQTALRIAVTNHFDPLSRSTVVTLLKAGADILEVDDDGVSLAALIREDRRYDHLLPLLEGRA
jgi:ankyrin repeat protein